MAESRISREDVESLGAGIPITPIAAEGGVGLAWLGIVGVNAAQRLGRDRG